MNNLLIVPILLGIYIGLSNGFDMLGGSKVTLSNSLEHNKLLKIRCDNDGLERLMKIGEEYEFTSDNTFCGATNHSCTMKQGPDNFKHHQEFVACDASWSKALEITCQWIAREDGIYYSQDGSPPLKKYEWDVPHVLKN